MTTAVRREAVAPPGLSTRRREGVRFNGPDHDPERQVKSVDRVRDLGEVFTPAATVEAMLDQLPSAMWGSHPSATFLEPACGDGNFLVAILDRKLARITDACGNGTLPAGATTDGLQFHALEALASIYAFDISIDNVVGGTPGHEVGARTRLVDQLSRWYEVSGGEGLAPTSPLLLTAQWIVDRNVQVANMLSTDVDGHPSGRELLALVEYSWDADTRTVAVASTTLGAVMADAEAETTGVMSLFAPPPPVVVWSGPPTGLWEAPIPASEASVKNARNGNGRSTR